MTSTTRPWTDGNLKGTQKVKTEEFKDYTVTEIIGTARDPSAPTTVWRSEHLVEYNKEHKLVKSASLTESEDLTDRIKKDSYASLMWYDLSGGRVSIGCKNTERTDGGSFFERLLARYDANKELVSGFEILIDRNGNGETDEDFNVADPEKHTWKGVKTKPEDTTGCDDPKFPFQLVKEKPL